MTDRYVEDLTKTLREMRELIQGVTERLRTLQDRDRLLENRISDLEVAIKRAFDQIYEIDIRT